VCELCPEKDRTIAALEMAVSALTELVNTQRALPLAVGGGLQASEVTLPPQPFSSSLELVEDEPDEDDIRAQLNAGGADTETAERLLAQLQVVRSPE
jgi:hypothetical protein